jgi:hypothetical protein
MVDGSSSLECERRRKPRLPLIFDDSFTACAVALGADSMRSGLRRCAKDDPMTPMTNNQPEVVAAPD